MKVLQINKYPSIKGGTEVVLFDTIKLLEEKGFEVVLFSTDEGETIFHPTYTVPHLKSNISSISSFFYNKTAVKQLEYLLIREKPDIAHIHLYLNGLSQAILPTLKKFNIPIVMTLHDYRQICPSYLLLDKHQNVCEKCKDGNYLNCILTQCSKGSFIESSLLTLEMYYRRLFLKTESYVDRFIFVSHFQRAKYDEFNLDISSKSHVIYNPLKKDKSYSISKGNYLLYFGRLSIEKGLNTLISAMRNFPNTRLLVAGKGTQKFTDLPPNIEFLGFKEHEELNELIKAAMFTIVPSVSYETFGLSCAESLSLGTPVIASNIGALPEIVTDELNGFLFEAGNSADLVQIIKKALNLSDEQYHLMAENGSKSIEIFSRENYIHDLIALYTTLLDT